MSSPAFIAISLSVSSADGRQHLVRLLTPRAHTLRVPGGGHASLLVAGLRAGRYQLEVDGVDRGALVIGGEPGP